MAVAFNRVNTGRVSAEIVQQVKAAIRDGRLAPGDQLPSERELTLQLAVSRVSLRDALRMLEGRIKLFVALPIDNTSNTLQGETATFSLYWHMEQK